MKRNLNYLFTMTLALFYGVSVCGADLPIIFEAESGTVGSSFKTTTSGGVTYVEINPTVGGMKPDSASRVITYTITFPEAGTYDLYARFRVGASTFDDDSYYYGNGFGSKNVTSDADWIRCNMLSGTGYASGNIAVEGGGNSANQVWVWLNMSEFTLDEAPITFIVPAGSLTQTFQIGGRENGLFFDKFAFGKSDLYFTVDNLNKGEAGSTEKPGEEPKNTPIALGKSKFLGSAYGSDSKYNFLSYWNQVTPGNAGKWASVEGTRDQMVWTELDESYNLAIKNKLPFKYHTLVWGQQQPAWIATLDSAAQREEILEWFAAVADRYDSLDMIDVVNEPLHETPSYAKALGGTGKTGWDWVINTFKLARQYFPKSKLILNEYSVTNSMSSAQRLMEIVKLLQKDSLIDGVGIQAHAFSTYNVSAASTKQCMDTIAATGLPIYPSEIDIDGPTDAEQVNEYMRIFPVFWEHPAVVGVTMWGYRPGMWRSKTFAYLINADRTMRPSMLWLRAYIQGKFVASKSITVKGTGNATTISAKGDSLQMLAEILPDTATVKNVFWSVSDTRIATISKSGLLKALRNGTVKVTATSAEYGSTVKGEIDITITNNENVEVKSTQTLTLKVFPNPAENELKLQNNSDIVSAEVINSTGQIIRVKVENNSINISSLSGGVYILKATDKSGKSGIVKFIKK